LPHIVAEYSANLEQSVDIHALLDVIHRTVVATKAFPLEVVRVRAARREHYQIADGNPRNAFLAIVGRIAPGRPQTVRRDIGEAMFNAVISFLSDVSKAVPLSITLELHEIDQTAAFRLNAIKGEKSSDR
jgi:5-carboxymethyl-2-hydroxymuconate isomerase